MMEKNDTTRVLAAASLAWALAACGGSGTTTDTLPFDRAAGDATSGDAGAGSMDGTNPSGTGSATDPGAPVFEVPGDSNASQPTGTPTPGLDAPVQGEGSEPIADGPADEQPLPPAGTGEQEALWVIEGTYFGGSLTGFGEGLVLEYFEQSDQEATRCVLVFSVTSTGAADCADCLFALQLEMADFELELDEGGACAAAGIGEAQARAFSPLAVRGEQVLRQRDGAWVPMESFVEHDTATGELFMEWLPEDGGP